VKPLSIVSEGTTKNKWWMWEIIIAGKLLIWAIYKDQRKWTILVWKQCMWEQWIEVSLYIIIYYMLCKHNHIYYSKCCSWMIFFIYNTYCWPHVCSISHAKMNTTHTKQVAHLYRLTHKIKFGHAHNRILLHTIKYLVEVCRIFSQLIFLELMSNVD
jgi:hypothetical protein